MINRLTRYSQPLLFPDTPDMIDLLSNTQYPVTCPNCNNTFTRRFRELETKTELTCPGCRKPFPVDRSKFKSVRKGQKKAF